MNFDCLAKCYGVMEAIAAGGKLQRCRIAFLDAIPPPRRVLLAGEGHGRFLSACAKRFPESEIVVVESSAGMIDVARARLEKLVPTAREIEFVHAPLLAWEHPVGAFDLIVTHFFLDCFPAQVHAEVVSRLGELATPDAHWLLADFQIATARLARLRSQVIVGLLYGFFRLVCGLKADRLVAPEEDFEMAGFSRHSRITSEWGLLRSEWWRRDSRDR